jgi:hypothetical protein
MGVDETYHERQGGTVDGEAGTAIGLGPGRRLTAADHAHGVHKHDIPANPRVTQEDA